MVVDEGGRFKTVRTQEEYGVLWQEDLNSLSPEEKETLESIITDFAAYGKSAIFEMASLDLYSSAPVDMDTFLDDPYYCGSISSDLFPEVRKDLIEVFSGCYNEALIGGSIGAGKSTFARYCILRMIYEASCLSDPYEAYGVTKGDRIAFPCISVTESQAHEMVFDKIKNSLAEIPYFKNDFKPEKITEESGIFFPKGIWIPPGLSTERRTLGINAFAAVIEEANFFKNIKNTNPNKANHPDMAEAIYKSIKRRMESRFLKKGKLPGMIILISSKTSVNSFTERRVKEAANNPAVLIREHAVYEVAPERYCGIKFRVALGNESKNSRILADGEADPEMMKVIEVPIEFRQAFEDDLESAIREIAGYATVSITPFITRRSSIYECIDKTREHPFSEHIWSHDVPGHFLWNKFCKQNKDGAWEPIHYPQAPRFLAIDLSKNQDATGMAMGCLGPYVSVRRIGKDDLEMVPSFHIDFTLRIEAATRGEIVQSEIRNAVYELSRHGFFIKQVSADSFQTVSMLQTFRQQGYQTKEVSVDKTPGPYSLVKLSLYEGRISYYRYEPLIREFRELQKNWKTGKIDHPDPSDNPKASKDVSDAVTQVVFQLNEAAKTLFVDVPLMTEVPNLINNDEYWVLENTMTVTNNPQDPRSNTGEVPEEDWKIAAKERLSNAQPQQGDWRNKFQMPFEQG
jgi:hypothetical protein